MQGIASACDRFTRYSSGTNKGQVSGMNRSLNNAGYQETAGYDLGVRYRLPEMAYGQLSLRWNTTYVDYLSRKGDNVATTPAEEFTGWGATSACAPTSPWIGRTATSVRAGPPVTTPA